MTLAQSITTAQQLWSAGDIGRCELVRGELIMMSPAEWNHGRIASRLDSRLRSYVEAQGLGEVAAAETGFLLSRNPDTVRAPDVAFVRRDRLGMAPAQGFFPVAPDLALEVLSPDDTAGAFMEKVQQWLEAGCAHVWVVNPKNQTITVYQRDGRMTVYRERDEVDGGELLPGFRLRVASVFE
jgi:Uma2 family endonuclease